jgi:hypothetical protein
MGYGGSMLSESPKRGPLEDALHAEARHLEMELEAVPAFRRLHVVRTALRELKAIQNGAAPSMPVKPGLVRPAEGGRIATSIAQAVIFALEESGTPVPTRQLLEDIRRYGRIVKAKNPVWGLSNMLSTDKRLQSVPWAGAKAWWFSGREVPTELPS